jgi:hypothetical protein
VDDRGRWDNSISDEASFSGRWAAWTSGDEVVKWPIWDGWGDEMAVGRTKDLKVLCQLLQAMQSNGKPQKNGTKQKG